MRLMGKNPEILWSMQQANYITYIDAQVADFKKNIQEWLDDPNVPISL
jgi:hypothetical protein